MATTRRYDSLARTHDARTKEDPDKHSQGGHDSRRNREEDPGGRVASQESRHVYQTEMYQSGNLHDADPRIPRSYTDPAISYTGRLAMLLPNAQVPNPDYSIRPKGGGEQEDFPLNSYDWRQPNQEKPKNGPAASKQKQASHHEARPPLGSRQSRAESNTKKTAKSSRQSANRRGPSRNVDQHNSDDDGEEEDGERISYDERVTFSIPSSGIDGRSYEDERYGNHRCMNYAPFVGFHAYTLISEVRAFRYCEATLADRLKCTA